MLERFKYLTHRFPQTDRNTSKNPMIVVLRYSVSQSKKRERVTLPNILLFETFTWVKFVWLNIYEDLKSF